MNCDGRLFIVFAKTPILCERRGLGDHISSIKQNFMVLFGVRLFIS